MLLRNALVLGTKAKAGEDNGPLHLSGCHDTNVDRREDIIAGIRGYGLQQVRLHVTDDQGRAASGGGRTAAAPDGADGADGARHLFCITVLMLKPGRRPHSLPAAGVRYMYHVPTYELVRRYMYGRYMYARGHAACCAGAYGRGGRETKKRSRLVALDIFNTSRWRVVAVARTGSRRLDLHFAGLRCLAALRLSSLALAADQPHLTFNWLIE